MSIRCTKISLGYIQEKIFNLFKNVILKVNYLYITNHFERTSAIVGNISIYKKQASITGDHEAEI